jgi:hypothetical protein
MAINPPNTAVRTSHAITLRANGITVGIVQSWGPNQSRTITPIYEINSETSGEPIENVPGNVGGLTISVSRYDLYTKRMEKAFGTPDSAMLGDHNNPFTVLEVWRFPNNSVETLMYTGCWFSSLGRQYSATDARVVLANAQLSYVRKFFVQKAS